MATKRKTKRKEAPKRKGAIGSVSKPKRKAAKKTGKKAARGKPKVTVSPAKLRKTLSALLSAALKQQALIEKAVLQLSALSGTESGAVALESAAVGLEARSVRKPPRSEIKPQVIKVIDDEAARNNAPSGKRALLRDGDETITLEDLNINLARRKMLSIDYSNISESYEGGKFVGRTAAGAADTVKKAINLVHTRSNG